MIDHTDKLDFPKQKAFYKGKVRDVYFFDKEMAVVVSDRISAFDHILPKEIPYKGQVLNLIAAYFLEASQDIIPNWLKAVPHPKVSIGTKCDPIRLEMVVRGYMAGHSWRTYKSGLRTLCGVALPEGMKEGQQFPSPIITPATKAEEGHDEDISAEDILANNIVSPALWKQLVDASLALFKRGTEMASTQGLILVDTKYEFGLLDDQLILIDEIHTPDSSRYYVADGYQERLSNNEKQQQLSKEFVREWLIDHDFQGKEGQLMPDIPEEFVIEISEKYIDLYTRITGKEFDKTPAKNSIEEAIKEHFS